MQLFLEASGSLNFALTQIKYGPLMSIWLQRLIYIRQEDVIAVVMLVSSRG